MHNILLDTCAMIWIVDDDWLEPTAMQELELACGNGEQILVSPISALEMGNLIAKGRYETKMNGRAWFRMAMSHEPLAYAELLPGVMLDSTSLPGNPPRDPADRIIIATAREYGYRVMTRDSKILNYAEQGHVSVIPC